MKCTSCWAECPPEAEDCPHCGKHLLELVDLYDVIEGMSNRISDLQTRSLRSSFLKELLNVCVRFKSQGIEVRVISGLLQTLRELIIYTKEAQNEKI